MLTYLLPLALLQSAAQAEAPPPAPSSPPAPPNCGAEEHAQFDFWVGEWDVYPNNGSETSVGHSVIERLYNGCAVRENWMPLSGQSGGSLNSYDPRSGQWHQKWIGSTPGHVEFVGGAVGNAMVLTGNWPFPSAPHALVRMTFTPNEDGSVRQHGEASTDHGLTWQTSFDFIYRSSE